MINSFRRKMFRGGMTLVELIVTVGIMSIVVAGAFAVFREGLLLFRTNQGASDAQSSAIRTLGRVTSEMANAEESLVAVYNAPGNSGVVFASPLDANGSAQYHRVTGKIYWQKWVCFYLEPNPSNPAKGKLLRREEAIPNEPGAALDGRTGSTNLNDVEAGLIVRDLGHFRADDSLPTRLMGDAVSGFSCEPFDGLVDDGNSGSQSVLGGSGVLNRKRSFDVTVETGDKNNNGPNGYYIKIDSRITPRG